MVTESGRSETKTSKNCFIVVVGSCAHARCCVIFSERLKYSEAKKFPRDSKKHHFGKHILKSPFAHG